MDTKKIGSILFYAALAIGFVAGWDYIKWVEDSALRRQKAASMRAQIARGTSYPTAMELRDNMAAMEAASNEQLSHAKYTAAGGITLLLLGMVLEAHGVNAQRKKKKCPHCLENILAEAKVCRYCGRDT